MNHLLRKSKYNCYKNYFITAKQNSMERYK